MIRYFNDNQNNENEELYYRIKVGVIFTRVGLLWMVIEKSMGWHDEHIDKHAKYTMLFMIPSNLMFVFAILEKRQFFLVIKWHGGKARNQV